MAIQLDLRKLFPIHSTQYALPVYSPALGLASAPWGFTKRMKIVVAHPLHLGIQIFPYLDDWQVWGRSRFYVQNNILVIRHLFSHLGLKLNGEK